MFVIGSEKSTRKKLSCQKDAFVEYNNTFGKGPDKYGKSTE